MAATPRSGRRILVLLVALERTRIPLSSAAFRCIHRTRTPRIHAALRRLGALLYSRPPDMLVYSTRRLPRRRAARKAGGAQPVPPDCQLPARLPCARAAHLALLAPPVWRAAALQSLQNLAGLRTYLATYVLPAKRQNAQGQTWETTVCTARALSLKSRTAAHGPAPARASGRSPQQPPPTPWATARSVRATRRWPFGPCSPCRRGCWPRPTPDRWDPACRGA